MHSPPNGSGRGKEPKNLAVTCGDGPGVLQDGRGCSQEGDAGAVDRWTRNPSGFLPDFPRETSQRSRSSIHPTVPHIC